MDPYDLWLQQFQSFLQMIQDHIMHSITTQSSINHQDGEFAQDLSLNHSEPTTSRRVS
jgi:hypothetical protein